MPLPSISQPLRQLLVPWTPITWTDVCATLIAGPGSPGSPVTGVVIDGYQTDYSLIDGTDSLPLVVGGTPLTVSLTTGAAAPGMDKKNPTNLVAAINAAAAGASLPTIAYKVDSRVRLYHASSIAISPTLSVQTSLRTGMTVGSKNIINTTASTRVLEASLSLDRTDLLSNLISVPSNCTRMALDVHFLHNESQSSSAPVYGGCSPSLVFAFTRAGWGETLTIFTDASYVSINNVDPTAGSPTWANPPLAAFDVEAILQIPMGTPFQGVTEGKPLEFDIPMGMTGFRFACINVSLVKGAVNYYPVYPDTMSASIAMGTTT